MIILIDGDILVYQVAFSVQVPIYVVKNSLFRTMKEAKKWAEKTGTPIFKRMNIGSEIELRKKLDSAMKKIFDDLGTHKYRMYITSSKKEHNFRHHIATIAQYKGNRAKAVKPIHYRRLREILVKEWDAIEVEGMEADDQLAIDQTEFFNTLKHYDGSIIASIDKDMLSIPGNHYNITKRVEEFIDTEAAFKAHCKQLLIGDATDNIPGLAKLLKLIGREPEAEHLINNKYIKKYEDDTLEFKGKECYNYILELYKKFGFGERELAEIWNLVWLKRYKEQDGWKDWKEGKISYE